MNAFGTVIAVNSAMSYLVQLPNGTKVEATWYGQDGATWAVGDRLFLEYAPASALWTISSGVD